MKLRNFLPAAAVILVVGFTTNEAQAQGTNDKPQYMNRGGAVTSTWQPSLVIDGVYEKVAHHSAPLSWQPVREADVLFKKRVWREIDTRQKQNLAFRYPGDDETGGGTFIEILVDAVRKGKAKAYSAYSEDRFQNTLTEEQISEMLVGKPDTIPIIDPVTGEESLKVIFNDFNPDAVTKFRIKEDVIFDRNLGRMVTRIIGICPIKDVYNPDDGSFRGTAPMFWLYYPELRETIAQYEVFNPVNDVARMNWDEFFENRFFASYIIKVSNPLDQRFQEMGLSPMEALHAGQEAQENLFNKEHDLWVY